MTCFSYLPSKRLYILFSEAPSKKRRLIFWNYILKDSLSNKLLLTMMVWINLNGAVWSLIPNIMINLLILQVKNQCIYDIVNH